MFWICCSLFIHLHNGISTTKVPLKRYQYLTTTAHTYSLSWMHCIYILQLWMYSTDSWLAWWHFKCMTPISLAHQLVCHTHGDACTEWPVHGTPFYHNIKRHGTLTIELRYHCMYSELLCLHVCSACVNLLWVGSSDCFKGFFLLYMQLFHHHQMDSVTLFRAAQPMKSVWLSIGTLLLRFVIEITSPTQWPSHLRPSSLLLSSHPPLLLWLLNTIWTTISVLWLPTVLGAVQPLCITLVLVR